MATEFLIIERGSCDKCEGDGRALHPIWAEFYEAHLGNSDLTEEDIAKWWKAKGFTQIPPQESNCGECDGQGNINRYVPLKQVLAVLSKDGTGDSDGEG